MYIDEIVFTSNIKVVLSVDKIIFAKYMNKLWFSFITRFSEPHLNISHYSNECFSKYSPLSQDGKLFLI